jgi:hypothetical protein
VGVRLAGEEPPQIGVVIAGAHCGERARIVCRIDENDHGFEVLRRRPEHARAANVNLLDHVARHCTASGGRLAGGGKVYGDQVDRLDAVRLERSHVLGVIASRQQAAVHGRVERLDPAAEDLGKTRDLRDLANGDAGLAQGARRTAGRDQLPPEVGQTPGQVDETRFVGHREESTGHRIRLESAGRSRA